MCLALYPYVYMSCRAPHGEVCAALSLLDSAVWCACAHRRLRWVVSLQTWECLLYPSLTSCPARLPAQAVNILVLMVARSILTCLHTIDVYILRVTHGQMYGTRRLPPFPLHRRSFEILITNTTNGKLKQNIE